MGVEVLLFCRGYSQHILSHANRVIDQWKKKKKKEENINNNNTDE